MTYWLANFLWYLNCFIVGIQKEKCDESEKICEE